MLLCFTTGKTQKLLIHLFKAAFYLWFPPGTPHMRVTGATPAAWLPHLPHCPAQARENQQAGDRYEGKCEEASCACSEMPLAIWRGSWRGERPFCLPPSSWVTLQLGDGQPAQLLGGCRFPWATWQVGEVRLQYWEPLKAQHVEGDETGQSQALWAVWQHLVPPSGGAGCSFHYSLALLQEKRWLPAHLEGVGMCLVWACPEISSCCQPTKGPIQTHKKVWEAIFNSCICL